MDLNEALRRGDQGDVADLGIAQLLHGLLLMQPELGPKLDAVAAAHTLRRRLKILHDCYRGPTCPPSWTFIARLEQLYKERDGGLGGGRRGVSSGSIAPSAS